MSYIDNIIIHEISKKANFWGVFFLQFQKSLLSHECQIGGRKISKGMKPEFAKVPIIYKAHDPPDLDCVLFIP